MIARLTNIERACSEVKEAGLNSVRIRPTGEKGQLGSRVGVTPDQVCEYIRSTHADFVGEYVLEVWKNGAKDSELKYVVVGGSGPAPAAAMNGAGVHPEILRLMQANHDLKLEALKLELQQGAGDNYMKEAIGLLGQMLNRANGAPAPTASKQVSGGRPILAEHQDRESEEEPDGEGDLLDAFIEVDPEAEDIVEMLVELKRTNPALYEQAKSSLKAMNK